MSETEKSDYCYKTTLKDMYGLTDSWIKRLGEPDKIVPNPHRRSTKSYLYLRMRVEAFIDENREDYERLQEGSAKRSAIATAVAERKRQETMELVNSATLKVHYLPQDFKKLYDDTLAAGIAFLQRRGIGTYYSDQEFTMSPNAITAYVRHQLTNYEQLLKTIEGKVGKVDAYFLIRDRVDSLINAALENQYGGDWLKFDK